MNSLSATFCIFPVHVISVRFAPWCIALSYVPTWLLLYPLKPHVHPNVEFVKLRSRILQINGVFNILQAVLMLGHS